MVRATWLVETGGAAPASAFERVDRGKLAILSPFVGHELGRGLASLQKNDVAAAKDSLARIRLLIDESRARIKEAGSTSSRFENVSESEFGYSEVMALELLAAIQMREGKTADAFASIAKAIAIEDATPFEYGPPPTVKPLHELHGDLLLKAGKPAEAAAAYERSTQRCPNRRLTMEGLEKARKAVGAMKSAAGS
jgi:predicted Zn-dependent protease